MYVTKFFIVALLFLPFTDLAQKTDTSVILNRLAQDLKNVKNFSYSYKMNVKFPNGDKDNMTGSVYLNMEDKIYYHDCVKFTMLYSSQWLYTADHENRTIELVDLVKESDKKFRKLREKEIFQNGALTKFLDSVLLKKGRIKQYVFSGNIYSMVIELPKQLNVQQISISFDTTKSLLVSCGMTLSSPFDYSTSGMRYANVNIECDSFRRVTDKSIYATSQFFIRIKNKTELVKYNNYKLTQL